ncbi:MAG: YifB family Mg chelatase-like AAA ATPase [Coriobacteriales bacterium]|jgi:magnesium chelatase family protein|nr:YifB family Mg chelatase-like AAA ATPase [Coriobacteriales bacterium]
MGTTRDGTTDCVRTATIIGVEAKPVTVEVSFTNGLPGISIVGMPDTAVCEARLRVRAALRACGFDVPNVNILVNLAPSDIPKNGSGFDLPIALGILLATGQICAEDVAGRLCVGELSLDGSVRAVRGMLAYAQLARELGLGMLSALVEGGVPTASLKQHSCVRSLRDVCTGRYSEPQPSAVATGGAAKDYCDIAGNDMAKRALTIAAAGEHALMMIGPPGSGKTMLASRLPTIMAPLNEEERFAAAMIHSVAGLPYDSILGGQKPFRAPHHSATRAGLMGGGSPVVPGEVSLAHHGILFLDEISEFGSAILQLLRQPVESGCISLARARGTTVLPASFMLVAASNPCPCGYFGDPERSCGCTDAQIRKYQGRIGGPLLDRIDMVIDVWRSKPGEVLATGSGTSSAHMREQVVQAQEYARWRVAEQPDNPDTLAVVPRGVDGTQLSGEGARLLCACGLGQSERACFEEAAERLRLSGRGIMRALSVARTIADLEQSERVSTEHLLEALTFRADGRCGNGSN